MSAIDLWLTQPAAQAIGRALLQFVWQGALIGGICALALAALRRSAADIRYVVAVVGLSLMLTVPVVTALQSWRVITRADGPSLNTFDIETPASQAGNPPLVAPRQDSETGAAPLTRATTTVRQDASRWMRLFLVVWFTGVAALTLRLMSGWLWVQRMKSRRTIPAAAQLQTIASRLRRRLHISRTVQLLESAVVDVPTVIGWLKPVILVPASAMGALSPQQLEAIIAHELAHIRRHDYLVNLLQTLVETLLFYHPAVWWLSRRIRMERENCCDDLAVSLCGDPITYARALADLEELRGAAHLTLAANGGSLLQRVRRLMGVSTHAGRGPGWLAGTVAVLLIAVIAGGAVSQSPDSEPRPATRAQASASSAATDPVVTNQSAAAGRQSGAAQTNPVLPDRPASLAATASEAEALALELSRHAQEAQAALADHVRAVEESAASMARAADAARAAGALPSLQGHATAIADVGDALSVAASAVGGVLPDISTQASRQSGNFSWSNGKEKLQVNYSGTIEFTDDDTDVKSISPGGSLRIREGGWLSTRTIEFRADASGALQRRYWEGQSEKPFEPEGRQWLAQALPRFIRQTGLGAQGRVARIFRTKGVDGVLAEISLIEGSWARRLYYSELLKTDGLEERSIEQVLARVGRDLDSDFELASLLIGSADRLLVSESTRKAYFEATRTIGSDFEMRRVYSAVLKKGPVSSDILAGMLDASLAIEGDFEASSLLMQIAKSQPLDARSSPAFFKVLAGVGSDFEHRRVLDALASSTDLTSETLVAILDSGASIDSDFEQASLLLTVLRHHSIEGAPRAAFFRAVDTIASPFERGRVLQAVAKRTDTAPETLVSILRATREMRGSFESSQVLLAVAASHRLEGEARELYIDAAERLGEFEQGRAMSALVKSDRGNR